MVNYAKGIPLVLKVLARLLRGKNKEVWESEVGKLEKMPLPEVYDVMKLSYDNLDRKEQQIFLDLACFFLQSDTKVEKAYLKYLLSDSESDNSVAVGLERLKDKALINFLENDFVSMHDSLKEMACEIVRRESAKDPGSCCWLWDTNDIYEALTNDKATGAIRSILLHSPLLTIDKQELSHRIFSKMSKLRFLGIFVQDNYDFLDIFVQHNYDFYSWSSKWQFWRKEQIVAKGPKFLLSELRYLKWHNYPLKSLPENLFGKELVILKLQGKMKKLWDGVKNLENLKELDLSFSQKLMELPDLSKATNLEVLLLCECCMLTSVHPSIFSLTKLEKLNLPDCHYLKTLPELPLSLETLDVSWCYSLQTLPEFPLSLKTLDVRCCKSLETLPELPLSLETLDVRWSSSLQTIPDFPLSPKTLIVSGCCQSLKTLPDFPLSLETIDVHDCKSLKTLPEFPLSLKTLHVQDCKSLKTLPELPLSLETLEVSSWYSLQTLPVFPLSLKTLDVKGFESLKTRPELPLSLETLKVRGCDSLQTLPKLPLSLKTLVVVSCKSLKTLPNFPLSLKTLDVNGCESLKILPELPLSLETLDSHDCNSMKTVLFPSTVVEQLKENRKHVRFQNFWNLDEQSLVAIGLNVQINVMKFANQHLSRPNQDHVENYIDYDNNYGSDQAVYVYPGSSVPEWLEYKTRKNDVIIDLSSSPTSPLLGFIFCFVIGECWLSMHPFLQKLKVIVTISESEGEKDRVIMNVDGLTRTYGKLYNVCVMYDQRCSSFLSSRAKKQTKFKNELMTFNAELKGFGVSPVNTSTCNSFIQQMDGIA